MENKSKIYVAGSTGLLGNAITSKLKNTGYINIITRTHNDLDLTRQSEVENLFKKEKPEYLILAAAKVGGINANISYPGQFIYENLAVQINVIHSAYLSKVKKLLFLGSACSYPRNAPQPMQEEYLLSGGLEPTNEPYAVAKIAGIKMCQAYNKQYGTNFICAIPANIYGPYDNFDADDSHVIAALIRKFHNAKINRESSVSVWGTGNPRREFIYVDDVADACIYLMATYNSSEAINIGRGEGVSIKELSDIIRETVNYNGKIIFDTSKPDGMPAKMLDVTKLKNLGWQAKTPLCEGIKRTYDWFLANMADKKSEGEILWERKQ